MNDPARYGQRNAGVSSAIIDATRGGGWNLSMLHQVPVNKFVIHYDVSAFSQRCFQVSLTHYTDAHIF
jgi:hypothetical protein